jgi:hypothetical protein
MCTLLHSQNNNTTHHKFKSYFTCPKALAIKTFVGNLITLVEICDFVTNEFATSCDYLTFTTTIGYIYNYCLHLKPLATTL